MDCIISTRNTTLTPAIKSHIEEKSKILDFLANQLTKCEVILEVKTYNLFESKVIVHGKGIDLVAISKEDDMYNAIHQSFIKMKHQLEKKLKIN